MANRSSGSRAHYMGAWSYFWLQILYSVPIVGLIFLIIHACTTSHENRCHYARSFFCWFIIVAVLALILVAVVLIAGNVNFNDFSFDSLKSGVESLF